MAACGRAPRPAGLCCVPRCSVARQRPWPPAPTPGPAPWRGTPLTGRSRRPPPGPTTSTRAGCSAAATAPGPPGQGMTTAASPRSPCRTPSRSCPGVTGIRPAGRRCGSTASTSTGQRPPGDRVFVDFDGVMVNATVLLNGHGGQLPPGRLPALVRRADRGPGHGPERAGGHRGRAVAAGTARRRPGRRPGDRLPGARRYLPGRHAAGGAGACSCPTYSPSRSTCSPPAGPCTSRPRSTARQPACGRAGGRPVRVTAELLDGSRTLAATGTSVALTAAGTAVARLHLTGLGDVTLWSPDTPKLYTVRTTVSPGRRPPTHSVVTRIGFREAVFRPDGFYLNGAAAGDLRPEPPPAVPVHRDGGVRRGCSAGTPSCSGTSSTATWCAARTTRSRRTSSTPATSSA